MKNTLLAIAVAVGTMFAAQAPQTSTPTGTTAPAKTTKTTKAHKHSSKHHKSHTSTAAPAEQK